MWQNVCLVVEIGLSSRLIVDRLFRRSGEPACGSLNVESYLFWSKTRIRSIRSADATAKCADARTAAQSPTNARECSRTLYLKETVQIERIGFTTLALVAEAVQHCNLESECPQNLKRIV